MGVLSPISGHLRRPYGVEKVVNKAADQGEDQTKLGIKGKGVQQDHAEIVSLGTFRDWIAYETTQGGNQLCYMASEAKRDEGTHPSSQFVGDCVTVAVPSVASGSFDAVSCPLRHPDRRTAVAVAGEAVFDATLKKIGTHKPGLPMAKELKTSAELKALLDYGVGRFSIGREPNPQWIKIVPADPDKEGANWRVAYSGPPGDFADAIKRTMRNLQTAYDLSSQE